MNAPPLLTVLDVQVASLAPHPRNPRTIDARSFAQLKASLQEKPDLLRARPLIALPDGTVVCGNMRLRAVQDLGWPTVPCVYADLDEQTAYEWMILDNNQLGSWQDADLAQLLGELKAAERRVDTLGFTDKQLKTLLAQVGMGKADPNVPEPASDADVLAAKWQTAPAQLWELPSRTVPGGTSYLLCGDSADPAAVALLPATPPAPLLVTDPPYGIGFGPRGLQHGDVKYNSRAKEWGDVAGDQRTGQELADWLCRVWGLWFPKLRAGGVVYCWAPTLAEGATSFRALTASGVTIQAQLIWAKNYLSLGTADYHWRHEQMWYGHLEGPHPWYGGRDQTTVWEIAKLAPTSYQHPTQKPVELYQIPLGNHTLAGERLLDPFAGSGTALVAAEQNARLCTAMELEPKWCAVALERMVGLGVTPQLSASLRP